MGTLLGGGGLLPFSMVYKNSSVIGGFSNKRAALTRTSGPCEFLYLAANSRSSVCSTKERADLRMARRLVLEGPLCLSSCRMNDRASKDGGY